MGKWILLVVLTISVFFGSFLLYMTLRDYKPKEVEAVTIHNNQATLLEIGQPFSVVTYNIGYAGLDQETDFFMDGGSMSRARSKDAVEQNLASVVAFIKKANPSILLIQELDVDSTRSYYVNQLEKLQNELADFSSTYAYNYKVDWVPVPLFNPMGKANSVISTFTKYKVLQSNRYQFPGQESWPVQLFELDRCFIENRMPVVNGKELVLINLHLSAFDEGGLIRQQQIAYLKKHIEREYEKDNYVIVGGDWNHILPTTDPALFPTTEDRPFWIQDLPPDFDPNGFIWVADKLTPSVRTMEKPYHKEQNYLAVIDGFLVSDNVEVLNVFGTNLEFKHTDHNPVTAEFILR